jgi:hypothetical protein
MMQRSIVVNRGLFLVRYDSAQDIFFPPEARVFVEPGSERHVSLILHPDMTEPVLAAPGTCLVVRAVETGKLRIEMIASQSSGSVAATIKLMPLSETGGPPYQQQDAALLADLDVQALRILGHVGGIGDVVVSANEWIGGPSTPSRIEGFAIQWPGMPSYVSLRYAAKIGGQNPSTENMVDVGSFTGTRGRALPLVGAVLELVGPIAAIHQLAVEAIFLGSPKMRLIGERVVLSGPTGREPLVGLRIGLEPIGVAAQTASSEPASPASPPTPSGRVRVFRSKRNAG